MNRSQAADIVAFAATFWPTVKTDRTAVDAWAVALAGTHPADAHLAVRQLAGTRSTIHVAAIVKLASELRADLVRRLPDIDPPRELADNARLFLEWQRIIRERQLIEARHERDNTHLLLPA